MKRVTSNSDARRPDRTTVSALGSVSAGLPLGQVGEAAPGPGDDHPVDRQPLHRRRRRHRQLGPQRVHPQIPSRPWTARLACGGLTSVSEVSTPPASNPGGRCDRRAAVYSLCLGTDEVLGNDKAWPSKELT